MTSIRPPRDDDGIVRRQLRRAGTPAIGKPRRGAPTGPLRPAGAEKAGVGALAGRAPGRERGPERRVKERRTRRTPVLLDTRSAVGNRRRGTRRGADRSAARSRGHSAGSPPAATLLDDDVYA